MRKMILAIPIIILLSGCAIPFGETMTTCRIDVVAPVQPRDAPRTTEDQGVFVAITSDRDVITVPNRGLRDFIPVTPAWYACSLVVYQDGVKVLTKISGPIEPVEIKPKRIVESEGPSDK